MSDHTSMTKASRQELDNARTKGQVIGWVQGAGAVFLLGVALKFLGWIPLLVAGGAVLFIGYKLLAGRKQ